MSSNLPRFPRSALIARSCHSSIKPFDRHDWVIHRPSLVSSDKSYTAASPNQPYTSHRCSSSRSYPSRSFADLPAPQMSSTTTPSPMTLTVTPFSVSTSDRQSTTSLPFASESASGGSSRGRLGEELEDRTTCRRASGSRRRSRRALLIYTPILILSSSASALRKPLRRRSYFSLVDEKEATRPHELVARFGVHYSTLPITPHLPVSLPPLIYRRGGDSWARPS